MMLTPSGPLRSNLIEIVVLVITIIILTLILHPMGGGRSRPTMLDLVQLKMTVQAQMLWTESSQSRFALPSTVDVANTTVPEAGRAKDTTANIYSLLIYNGLLTPETLLSPVERGNIEQDDDYQLASPSGAVVPANALWDPDFRADFTGDEPGNASYAHEIPHPLDGGPWQGGFNETRPAFSTRGPFVSSVAVKASGDIDSIGYDRRSITNRFYGKRDTWSGHVAYNDGSVIYATDPATGALYTTETGQSRPDVLFYDEPDSGGRNNFLSIFVTAGDQRSDFGAIWD